MTDIERLLDVLVAGGVDFVVIGGVALVLRGSTRVTVDLDICYERSMPNLARLARALTPHQPRLRGAPLELPFLWDERTLHSGLNFTLTTALGDIDLLGEVPGIGQFAAALAGSAPLVIAGKEINVLDLDALERSKRAAGRAKDLLDLAEIAEIRRQLNK